MSTSSTNRSTSRRFFRRCFFSLTNADKSPVRALLSFIGYDCELFICATQDEYTRFRFCCCSKVHFFPIIATHPPVAIIVTDGYVCIKVLFFGIVKRERILNNIGCLNLRSAKVPEHIFYLAEVCPDNIDQIANQVI